MKSATAQLVGGVVSFIALLVAYVMLTTAGADTTGLIALGGPVVMGLLVTGHVTNVTDKQNQTIDKIDKQTNGVMDGRIRSGVEAVLRANGLIPEADPAEPSSDGS